jgi:flagellar biosynthetic protein FliR
MSLDELTVWSGTLLFARFSALLLAAPMIGTLVPVTVRVFAAAVLSWALLPFAHGPDAVPKDVVSLALGVASSAAAGLLTGLALQAVLWAFQTAGNVLDLQVGTGAAQLLNPAVGTASAPVGQFHALLGTVLVFLTDSHHMVVQGLLQSPPPTSHGAFGSVLGALEASTGAALLIAAPALCATVLIDVASALVARAVPQAQPYFIALPAKLAAGLLIVALGLPGLAIVAQGLARALTDR